MYLHIFSNQKIVIASYDVRRIYSATFKLKRYLFNGDSDEPYLLVEYNEREEEFRLLSQWNIVRPMSVEVEEALGIRLNFADKIDNEKDKILFLLKYTGNTTSQAFVFPSNE